MDLATSQYVTNGHLHGVLLSTASTSSELPIDIPDAFPESNQ